MADVRAFLSNISADLGDQADGGGPLSWARWSEARLLAFLNEGYAYIAGSVRPNDFTSVLDIKLATGSLQDARSCGCTRVLKVSEQVDAAGTTLARLDNPAARAQAELNDWGVHWRSRLTTRQAPTSTPDHRLTSARRDANAASLFYVLPAVPPRAEVYARVVCAGVVPPALTLSSQMMPEKFSAPLRYYVMAAALGTESESTEDQGTSRDHFQRFEKLVVMGYTREEATPRVVNTSTGQKDA